MKGTVIAFGTFDGMHEGHRAIMAKTIETAEAGSLMPMIYTFTTHPMAAFGRAPGLLMTDGERLEALGAYCTVIAEDFTPEYSATLPEKFVEDVFERYGMAYAVAGFNYTFGSGGRGNTALLEKMGKRMGFGVAVVPPVMYNGEPVSSTRVRQAVERGDITDANTMLGRRYSVSGIVEHNRGIGHSIGFPTANIGDTGGRVIPGSGVYAATVSTPDGEFPAVTNVGNNPTVQGDKLSVESHIMGFSKDLYGELITVHFVKKLRDERRFDTLDDLVRQIGADKLRAADILKIN